MEKIFDKTIKQTTFLGLKGGNVFVFKEKGIQYKLDDKKSKIEMFIKYEDIDINKNHKEVNITATYYVLVGTLFIIYGIIGGGKLFFILFGIIFLYVYYKSKENFIIVEAYPQDLFINKDNKLNDFLDEIKYRKTLIKKDEELKVNKYSTKEEEKERFDDLLNDGIITQNEYNLSIDKINDLYNILIYNKKAEEIIKHLLSEKGINGNFKIEDAVFERKYLPGGLDSFSGIIVIENNDKYTFWFDWDKNAKDPNTGEKGYYTLGDSKDIIKNYGRSFFSKIDVKNTKKK